jgi:hypothetical protein
MSGDGRFYPGDPRAGRPIGARTGAKNGLTRLWYETVLKVCCEPATELPVDQATDERTKLEAALRVLYAESPERFLKQVAEGLAKELVIADETSEERDRVKEYILRQLEQDDEADERTAH